MFDCGGLLTVKIIHICIITRMDNEKQVATERSMHLHAFPCGMVDVFL